MEGEKILNLATKIAEESGISPRDLIEKLKTLIEKLKTDIQKAEEMCRYDSGKYKVICLDQFSTEAYVEGEYNTSKQALEIAREKTKDVMKLASDSSVATVYLAFNPDGKYLGGNVWENE